MHQHGHTGNRRTVTDLPRGTPAGEKIEANSDCPKSGHFLGKSKFQIPKIVVIFRAKFGRDSRKAEIEITAV